MGSQILHNILLLGSKVKGGDVSGGGKQLGEFREARFGQVRVCTKGRDVEGSISGRRGALEVLQ